MRSLAVIPVFMLAVLHAPAQDTTLQIVQMEYFFDSDPGGGNGHPLPVTMDSSVDVMHTILVDTLSPGHHVLYVRARDSLDGWGFARDRTFIVGNNNTEEKYPITHVEYFFDTDPGEGGGTPLALNDSMYVDLDTVHNLNGFVASLHRVYVRAKNTIGGWSQLTSRPFLFDNRNIEFAEYKVDSLPTYADWTDGNPFTPDLDVTTGIDIVGIHDLGDGQYAIKARVRRKLSWWSEVFIDSIPARILYVDSAAAGDHTGINWENAFNEIQTAFDTANFYTLIEEIWVAKAKYYPTDENDRTISFILPDSVLLASGFLGFERQYSERNVDTNRAILSGDIGVVGDTSDNSYHVIFNPPTSSGAQLDGLIIEDGRASGVMTVDQTGGGLANYGELTVVNTLIRDCTSVGVGPLIYNSGMDAKLTLMFCQIVGDTITPMATLNNAEVRIKGSTGSTKFKWH